MKKNNLATFEDFAKLNGLIEEDNVKGIYDFFVEVIQTRYGAGHQEQHLRSLKSIMIIIITISSFNIFQSSQFSSHYKSSINSLIKISTTLGSSSPIHSNHSG